MDAIPQEFAVTLSSFLLESARSASGQGAPDPRTSRP